MARTSGRVGRALQWLLSPVAKVWVVSLSGWLDPKDRVLVPAAANQELGLVVHTSADGGMMPTPRSDGPGSAAAWPPISRPERLGALSGTAASLTLVTGMLVAGVGSTSDIRVDGPVSVQEEFTEGGWWLSIGAALSLLGVVLLVVFLAVLTQYLWQRTARPWLAVAAFGGGLLVASCGLIISVLTIAASNIEAAPFESDAAHTIRIFKWGAARILVPPALIVVAVVAVSGLHDAAFPRWLTRVSAGFAMLLVVSLTGLIPQGLLALVFMLWIGVTGLVLWRVLLRTASSP